MDNLLSFNQVTIVTSPVQIHQSKITSLNKTTIDMAKSSILFLAQERVLLNSASQFTCPTCTTTDARLPGLESTQPSSTQQPRRPPTAPSGDLSAPGGDGGRHGTRSTS